MKSQQYFAREQSLILCLMHLRKTQRYSKNWSPPGQGRKMGSCVFCALTSITFAAGPLQSEILLKCSVGS